MGPVSHKGDDNVSAFAVYSKKRNTKKRKKISLMKNAGSVKKTKLSPATNSPRKWKQLPSNLGKVSTASKIKQTTKKKKMNLQGKHSIAVEVEDDEGKDDDDSDGDSVNDFVDNNVDGNNEEEPESENELETESIMEDGKNDTSQQTNSLIEIQNLGSIKEGRLMLEWIIHPLQYDTFIKDPWEKRPYHGKRNHPSYYTTILSVEGIDKMLRAHNLKFTKNVDVTEYRNGTRKTLNPPGRATAERVWDFYSKGCSVRLLNPQTFIRPLGIIVATLQELFGCMVGANVYLTPQDAQGFAPHYDDIEAFILQIEGKKHWRVYSPRNDREQLPRFSSENFTQEELEEPVLEVTLNAGDILYFPRGFIHQANTVPGEHSLHITLSCYQRNTWADFFEKMLPAALSLAIEDDVEFRRGLPVGYLQYMGIAHSDKTHDPRREEFTSHLRRLFDKLANHLPTDSAADQMAKDFMHDAFPPVLSDSEQKSCVLGRGLKMNENGELTSDAEIGLQTKVKLLRANILRIVMEEDDGDTVTIHHYADNSLEYHGEDPQSFKISADSAVGIEFLINSYPLFTSVSDFPFDDDEEKVSLASDLWQRGLLLMDD